MPNLPGPLDQLDLYFAAATIAHELANDLHRELVELAADDADTRELLRESASIATSDQNCRRWPRSCGT